jgi:deoxyribonuclease IV
VLIGAHVRGGGPLTARLDRGVELGADAVQIFTQSPRAWKPTQYAPALLAAYRDAARGHESVRATFAHATYLINLATADTTLLSRSVECLTANLSVARGMGASGLVLHVGSHHGAGLDGVLAQIAAALEVALDHADDPEEDDLPACPILLENAAGSGGTVGRTLEELEYVLDATGRDERVGLCIDTQHLWASGVDYSTIAGADAIIDEVRSRFGLDRLGCVHLNDSKVPFASNRDRHENLGDGSIGADGLAAFVGHPALATVNALLEVPGEGDGPRAVDVTAARSILARGEAMRSGRSPLPARSGAAKATAKSAATRSSTAKTAATKRPAAGKPAAKKPQAKKPQAKKPAALIPATAPKPRTAPKARAAGSAAAKRPTGAKRSGAAKPATATKPRAATKATRASGSKGTRKAAR